MCSLADILFTCHSSSHPIGLCRVFKDAPGSPVMSFNRPGWKFHLLCIQSGWHSSERSPLPELRVEMCFNGTVLCSFAVDAAAAAATGDAAMHYGKRVAV